MSKILSQVVDAVNCARRGWINVDLDSITCESCGARLLFSTPASWSHQQGVFHCLFHLQTVLISL